MVSPLLHRVFASPATALSLAFMLTVGCGGGGSTSAGNTSATATPTVAVSSTNLSFGAVSVSSTATPQTVTVTSSGTAPLQITSVALADTSNYAYTSTCGISLVVGSSCTLAISFTPKSAGTLNSTLTLTDNAGGTSGTTQTITLTGSGTSAPVATGSGTRLLYTVPTAAADSGYGFLYTLVNNAKSTIDMTMYELADTTMSGDLVAACSRGVKVRVILDQNNEKSANALAFAQLNAQANCTAVYANKAFQVTHQKSLIFDGTTVAIMTLNLASRYYTTTRDYAVVETDANDIAAIQSTFNADYAAGTTAGGAVGTSDYSYVPAAGDDLIWSPTTAQTALVGLINGATKTLDVENEEMSAAVIVTALSAACQRGVTVHIAMVNQSSYTTNFNTLKSAGCSLHLYPDTTTGYYIHAKAMVADYGLATQSTYVGSINFSNASMNQNRELGMYLSDPTLVGQLEGYMASDYNGGTAY